MVNDTQSTIWEKISEKQGFKLMIKFIRRGLVFLIIGLILYQLYDIGWREVVNSLPSHPIFYILFCVLYITLPFSEVFIYQRVWDVKKWDSFKAFLTKRVFNEEVMGYSGEFYLFMWAKKSLNKGKREILKNIRDNNILSSATSNLVAFSLVGILIFAGIIDLEEIIGNIDIIYIIAVFAIATVLIILFVQFRRYLFDLPLKHSSIIFSIYLVRFLIHHTLLIIQWAVVIPDTSLNVWFTFLAVIIIVNRIPFLPSRDLIFMWAGIELSRSLNMATASVAGMLLVSSALKKCTNLVLYLLISWYSKEPEIKKDRLNG